MRHTTSLHPGARPSACLPACLPPPSPSSSPIVAGTHGNAKVFNVNTVDLAARCAAALGASKLVYIADGSHLEDTITGKETIVLS